jgi:hypothetical protein
MKYKHFEEEIKVGSRLYFITDKRPFVVKAMNDRFIIATKPFNVRKTCLYTILDMKMGIRGPNNLVFNMYDYTKQPDIEDCLNDLSDPDEVTEVSRRRSVSIDILKIENR